MFQPLGSSNNADDLRGRNGEERRFHLLQHFTEAKSGNANASDLGTGSHPEQDALVGRKMNVPAGFPQTGYANSIGHEVCEVGCWYRFWQKCHHDPA